MSPTSRPQCRQLGLTVTLLATGALFLVGCAVNGRQHATTERYQRLVAEAATAAPHEERPPDMPGQVRLASAVGQLDSPADQSDDTTEPRLPPEPGDLPEPNVSEPNVSEPNRTRERSSEELPDWLRELESRSRNSDVEDLADDLPDEDEPLEPAGDDEEDADVEEDGPDIPLLDRTCVEENPLTLPDVLQSVLDSYPLLEVALAELATADGNALATWGSFDSVLSGYSITKALGFYETYQNGAKLARPLWQGGEVYGGYRIGRGVFEPWYLERQTNEGGEFKTGIKQPLLKGYAIDGRRAAIQTAQLERLRLEPDIRARMIGMQLAASQLYWKWVAAGQVVRTQQRLVKLAEQRNDNLIRRVEEGDLPKITEIDNGRFIAKRQVKLVESRRKVQEAAIKMSLFYRDSVGQPLVVADDRLPCDFPTAERIAPETVEADIMSALAQRPELLELDYLRQQVEVDLCYYQNQTLPKLDAYAEAGQDVGEPTSSKRDKSELELEMGLLAEVPLQRRAALGKIQAARGKLAQIAAKRQFTEDKIRSQVQDAVSALRNAFDRIEQARENLRLTEQSLRLGRLRFEAGDIDLIALNIYETSLADAELLLIEAEFAYFAALADYQAALAASF